jgi:phosphoribosylformylglycinamidine cyclo-ligase
MARKVTYEQSGVSIDTGDEVVEDLKKINPSIGGFGGMVPIPTGYKTPRLVLSTDGVGTKLLVAKELGVLNTIGIDLVAMVVNDIITMGARPFAFLDYYATAKLKRDEAREILRGIVEGCRQADCELVGGETAELPGIYEKGIFDLAGFGVGVVDHQAAVTGRTIKSGDVVIGLPSSGIHSNGYSLARRVLLESRPRPRGDKRRALLEQMLVPTAIYVKPIRKLLEKVKVKGIAHITGGGLPGNLVRVLPDNCQAVLDPDRWEVPEIFRTIAQKGPVAPDEMYRVFNMGIGMCVVVSKKDAREAIKVLRRSMVHAIDIGVIEKGPAKVIIGGEE